MPCSSQISHLAPGGLFSFCLRHICGSKSFSAWPSARCFCSSSRLRFLSRYIQRGRMCGADVSNIRHKLPITPSAASIGPSLCHCARRCSKRCANSFPSCAALRSSSSAFAQSLGTPFPRMYSFPNWYFAQGVTNLRTYTSDACAASAKAVPRILRPQHGLSRSENISQACIWQIRSHAPQPVQTSPRLSFRRRTATSHPRAAFRARIPQNDFPAL